MSPHLSVATQSLMSTYYCGRTDRTLIWHRGPGGLPSPRGAGEPQHSRATEGPGCSVTQALCADERSASAGC